MFRVILFNSSTVVQDFPSLLSPSLPHINIFLSNNTFPFLFLLLKTYPCFFHQIKSSPLKNHSSSPKKFQSVRSFVRPAPPSSFLCWKLVWIVATGGSTAATEQPSSDGKSDCKTEVAISGVSSSKIGDNGSSTDSSTTEGFEVIEATEATRKETTSCQDK